MFAKVSEGWTDFGVYVTIVTGTLVLIGLIAKSPPGRWLAKNLVGEPLREWIQSDAVMPVLDAHEERMKEHTTAIVKEVIGEHTSNEETLAQRLVTIVGGLDTKVDQMQADLEQLKAS